MPLFEWTSMLSVGVADFDSEHRRIGNLLNELYDLQDRDGHAVERQRLLRELLEQIQSHFANEERHFREYGYEKAEEHHTEHERLLEELKKMSEGIQRGEDAGLKLANYLHAWLTTHVLVTDKQYADFFRGLGVK